MKHRNTIVTILLNILFCIALLWFFSRNAFLRPYLGSATKEFCSGLLLLATLYANYYILYPKLYRGHTSLYWLSVVAACLVAGAVELALGYPLISQCHALRIKEIGAFHYFTKLLFLVFSRNLAFNFFPYMLRERKQLRQSLETEVKVVYQYARMIDVCDDDNNCRHIPADDILYCQKNGNETDVHTVDGVKYTRYCTIKYLSQHLGDEEFVRISPSVIVPFRHIASCDGKTVVMKKMSDTEKPLTFDLDTQRHPQAAAAIAEHLRADQTDTEPAQPDSKEGKAKRSPSVPPQGKLDTVLNYIREHPGCRSTEIIAHTSYPKTTLDRCLSDLKRQGLIEYQGSKKTGGYCVVGDSMESMAEETAQGQGKVARKKVLKEKSAKKKLTEGKPAEPSSKE